MSDTKTDTHGLILGDNGQRVYKNLNRETNLAFSESIKASNLEDLEIDGFEIGAGSEDCADFNRGRNLVIKNGTFNADGAKQAITIKGGFDTATVTNVHFIGKPKLAYVTAGGYSDFNMCKKLVTKNIKFNNCTFEHKDVPAYTGWSAEKPKYEDCGSPKTKMVNGFIVWAYFTFRRIQQFCTFGPKGRNGACKKL
jgi:hypothetical protein